MEGWSTWQNGYDAEGFPYLGGILGFANTGSDLSAVSANYAYLGGTTECTSPLPSFLNACERNADGWTQRGQAHLRQAGETRTRVRQASRTTGRARSGQSTGGRVRSSRSGSTPMAVRPPCLSLNT